MKDIKIIGYSNITNEGLSLQFNKKFKLNPHSQGMANDKWWISWDKLSELFNKEKTK